MTQALPAPRRALRPALPEDRARRAAAAAVALGVEVPGRAKPGSRGGQPAHRRGQAAHRQSTAQTQPAPRTAGSRRAGSPAAAPDLRFTDRGPSPKRSEVLARCRPSPERASAAALLVGAAAPALNPDGRPRKRPDRTHLAVVDDSKQAAARRRRRTRLTLVIAAVVGFGAALALVYVHVAMAQRQFTLDNIDNQVQQQQLRYQQLRYEVAQLGSPQQIITQAEGKLAMVQPTSVNYLTPTVTIPGTSAGSEATYSPLTGQAPAGDSDWPQIKSQLAGSS